MQQRLKFSATTRRKKIMRHRAPDSIKPLLAHSPIPPVPAIVPVMPAVPAANPARAVIGPDHPATRAVIIRVVAAVESRTEEMSPAEVMTMPDKDVPADK